MVPYPRDNDFIGRKNLLEKLGSKLNNERSCSLTGRAGVGYVILSYLSISL